ncbi:bifunctional lysylphosphatidylglycerol flippase/synthetase MprF [Glutamicibacter arilaitensis]|uniref:bifunctional lysylphosphatidylglycerol flippase/synthetase MprF n=1 Tax=Glutamicibacter arilaitensis TaxID=256701 RepID=UPI00384A985D
MTRSNFSAAARVQRRDRARAAACYLAIFLGLLSLFEPLLYPVTSLISSWLRGSVTLFPEFLTQISRIYAVFGAFGLFVVARYLRGGNRVAWAGSLLLLLGNAVLHLSKPSDWPVLVLSLAAGIWLGAKHRAFPVWPGRFLTRRVALISAGVLGVATLLALGLLVRLMERRGQGFTAALREVFGTVGGELAERGTPPRWEVVVALLLCLVGMLLWFVYSANRTRPAGTREQLAERERARKVVLAHGGGTLDYFALRDDKQYFFLADSVIAYAVRGAVCLVSPDPIGPEAQREEIWAEFMLLAERRGLSVSVLGAAASWLPIYERSGLRPIYLGDEAIVDTQRFTFQGKRSKSLRQGHARLARAGYTVAHLSPREISAPLRERLTELSTQSRRGEAERGFSMTLSRLFDPADEELMLSIALDAQGLAQAFIQWVPAPAVNGWSLDVMRRSTAENVPGGLSDFVILETIFKLRSETGGGLGLNFAVLREAIAGGPEASRFERLVARQASKHARMTSLGKFNAKYDPTWQPRYAAVGTVDRWLTQGLAMVQAEGYADLPGLSSRSKLPRSRDATRNAGGGAGE